MKDWSFLPAYKFIPSFISVWTHDIYFMLRIMSDAILLLCCSHCPGPTTGSAFCWPPKSPAALGKASMSSSVHGRTVLKCEESGSQREMLGMVSWAGVGGAFLWVPPPGVH